jgi:hypothetical protein
MEDAKNIGELVALGWTRHTLVKLHPDEITKRLHFMRSRLAEQAKAAFLQPLMDTCSAAPPGQPMPKIKISVYLDDGNVFEYEVDTVTSAREHVSLIVKTGYRHSDRDRPTNSFISRRTVFPR